MDQQLIQQGFPSHTLMELAGKGAAEYPTSSSKAFAIFVAREIMVVMVMWSHAGFSFEITCICRLYFRAQTEDAIRNAQWCYAPQKELHECATADVVDAMLGTGQNRAPSTIPRRSQTINKMRVDNCTVYALIFYGSQSRNGCSFWRLCGTNNGCFSLENPKKRYIAMPTWVPHSYW